MSSTNRKGRVGLLTDSRERKNHTRQADFIHIAVGVTVQEANIYTPETTGVTICMQHKLMETPVMIYELSDVRNV